MNGWLTIQLENVALGIASLMIHENKSLTGYLSAACKVEMSRTPLTFLPHHQDDIVIRHLSYYRKPSHLTTWPWPSRGKSGSSWPLLRRPCTGTWCWRTTATWCPWVRTAAWVTDQFPSQWPFLSQLLKALECLWCSVSSLAHEKWVYSPFSCEKSLDCRLWDCFGLTCSVLLSSQTPRRTHWA